MQIAVYGHKNQTVKSLRWCFMKLHNTKAPSGDLVMSPKVRDAKMAWLQIWSKLECPTGLSNESSSYLEVEEEDNDD
eukprot:1195001-Ditylum_brightwellii.AAC.1